MNSLRCKGYFAAVKDRNAGFSTPLRFGRNDEVVDIHDPVYGRADARSLQSKVQSELFFGMRISVFSKWMVELVWDTPMRWRE